MNLSQEKNSPPQKQRECEPVRKKGDKYDAHHIIENSFEGEHEWGNIYPSKFPNEHQSGIHGTGSPANELFKGGK